MKRTNSLLKKSLSRASQEQAKAFTILCAVLAQRGGSVMVTKGTLDQAAQNLSRLSYQVEKGEAEGEFIVKVVEAEPTITATTETQLIEQGSQHTSETQEAQLLLQRMVQANLNVLAAQINGGVSSS